MSTPDSQNANSQEVPFRSWELDSWEFGSDPEPIDDQRAQEEWQVCDGEQEELASVFYRTMTSEHGAQPEKDNPQTRGHCTVGRSRQADARGQQTHGPACRRAEESLT